MKRVRRKRGSRCCAHRISHVGTEAQRGSGQLSRAGAHSPAPQPRPTGFSRVSAVLAAAGGRCLASCPALPADLTAFREWLSAAVGANRAASSSALHRLPARATPPGWASERPPLPHQGLPDIRGCRSAQPHLGASGDGRPFWKFPSQSSSWAQAQTHRGPAVRPGTRQLPSLPLPPWWKAHGRTRGGTWDDRLAFTAGGHGHSALSPLSVPLPVRAGSLPRTRAGTAAGAVPRACAVPVTGASRVTLAPGTVPSTVTVPLLRAGRALATGARADLASSCHLSLWVLGAAAPSLGSGCSPVGRGQDIQAVWRNRMGRAAGGRGVAACASRRPLLRRVPQPQLGRIGVWGPPPGFWAPSVTGSPRSSGRGRLCRAHLTGEETEAGRAESVSQTRDGSRPARPLI